MYQGKRYSAILLLAGRGERFSSYLPKQFHLLGNKSLYLHSLAAFLQTSFFEEICLVVGEEYYETVKQQIEGLPHVKIVVGGKSRQESSYLGVSACRESDFVVIHDGVRPFVSFSLIAKHVEAVRTHGAVDTCLPSADTVVRSLEGKWVDSVLNRQELFLGQTPQSFATPLILQAHEQARKEGLTSSSCDCNLVRRLGTSVYMVEGDENNFKVTTPKDLLRAQKQIELLGAQE